MGIKILVSNENEQAVVQEAIGFMQDATDHYVDQDHDAELSQIDAFNYMMENYQVTVGTAGALDTALMAEIGKAYKEQFTIAEAAGDEIKKNQMIGAMYAVKRLMEMVAAPKY